jgi:YegS/Rv2252/BmrU family lipid kinase
MIASINMNHNVVILVNPCSGKGKAIKTGHLLQEKLTTKKIQYSLCEDIWPKDLSFFTEVWIVGGDGTMNYFLNHYPDNHLPVALFKGGTGNDFAWKLYGNISLEEQIELVLSAKAKPVDAGICNGKLYANSLGIGFDGEVLRSINTIRWLGGHVGYLLIVIKKIFSFKEFSFKITTADKIYEERFLLVTINNSSRTGGGFMITPEASITDGKLDMILCKQLPILKRLKYLPVIEKGKHIGLPFIYFNQDKNIFVECEQEIYAQLDGELISGKIFDISCLPGRLLIKY